VTLPTFYYANGTSYLFNWFGFQFSILGIPTLLFGQPVNSIASPALGHIAGLDGQYFLWQEDDPFPFLLSPELWNFQRVPYPASTAFIGPSIEVGVDYVINQILGTPIGTPFALGGYSQGAAVMSRVYNECRQGRLANRRADLRAMVTFGNPMRERGHTFPNSSGYSGACDIPGDTSQGQGAFPGADEIDIFSGFIRRFARLQNTEDLVWDFTMPNEVISGVGDSREGNILSNFTKEGLRQVPLAALLEIFNSAVDGAMALTSSLGLAPPGVPQGTDPSSPNYRTLLVTDPVTGAQAYQSGGGHVMYPLYPPPNADGSIPTSGDTCYQLAAKYLNSVGARLRDERSPVVAAPTSRAALSWFTSLPGG
jgi:hypothetical protein